MTYLPALFPSRRPERLGCLIREMTSGWDVRRVARLHRRINRGDRLWLPPPRGAIQRALAMRWQTERPHGTFGVFVAEARSMIQADELVGSIAVWLADASETDTVAQFGLFEVINDPEAAEQLIEAAEMWLLERFPITVIRGPYGLNPTYVPGLLTDGFNVRSARGLPYNPPYYPEIIASAGYEPCAPMRTYVLPARTGANAPHVRVTAATGSVLNLAWVEGGDMEDLLRVEPEILRFPLWLDERLSSRMAALRRSRRLLARPSSEWVASATDGRWPALGVAAAEIAAQWGYAEVLLGPISDAAGALGGALTEIGARPAHTYQVFEKVF